MKKLNGSVTDSVDFFNGSDPFELTETYGSPLYVYNERILRKSCRELIGMCDYPKYQVTFSVKANSNLAIMQIVREEGLLADAMSQGEIHVGLEAGFSAKDIFFIPNNISEDEMQYAIERGILTSADSISQLEQYGTLNPGGRVAVRFNPGIGAGHCEKVITAGKEAKFGVNPGQIQDVKNVIKRFNLKLVGINQHIGSMFMEKEPYLNGASALFDIAKQFDDLEFIDLGGGLGTPCRKMEGEKRFDLNDLGESLSKMMRQFSREYGKELTFMIEPGRYVVAEAGLLLGTVHAVKHNDSVEYVGSDMGFNVLARPILYDAHHDIEVYTRDDAPSGEQRKVNVVGNICESGDIIAKDRLLPKISEGDLLGVLDAGAYGHVMSSNYNNRLRPAEVLLREDNSVRLIRNRDSLEDLTRPFIKL